MTIVQLESKSLLVMYAIFYVEQSSVTILGYNLGVTLVYVTTTSPYVLSG